MEILLALTGPLKGWAAAEGGSRLLKELQTATGERRTWLIGIDFVHGKQQPTQAEHLDACGTP